ncbi:MAG: hypothetical protein JXI43_06285, partial [Tissierellales bacterium]|nr:hypothetical protein [Tissierellales bacterium]
MNIFFGKISSKREKAQIAEGYYRAPKKCSWFNGLDVGDYALIIGGGKVQLWQAEEWTQKDGDDILQFKIIHDNLGITTKQLPAIKYFTLTMDLIVKTVRMTAQEKKAFFPIEYDADIFTEDMLKNADIYKDDDTYRKIHILDSNDKPTEDSKDLQLYKENAKWRLFNSPFISQELIDSFQDNTNMLGNGQVRKDNTINIVISPANSGKKLSADELSILEMYDLFCCDYKEKGITVPDETRYWMIAPGRQATFWEKWREKGIITIGWDKLGNLSGYSSKEEMQQ